MRGVCVLGGVGETSFVNDALPSGIDRASFVISSNISVKPWKSMRGGSMIVSSNVLVSTYFPQAHFEEVK